jgi:hypothetical protein
MRQFVSTSRALETRKAGGNSISSIVQIGGGTAIFIGEMKSICTVAHYLYCTVMTKTHNELTIRKFPAQHPSVTLHPVDKSHRRKICQSEAKFQRF